MKTGQTVKILLVDERKDNLLSLALELQDENYTFVEANSGMDALKILMKEQDFAIILMDIQMTLQNGLETAELIRQSEKLKYIPVIFLAAENFSSDNIIKGYLAGAVDCIVKPYNPEILKLKVDFFVDLYKKNHKLILQSEDLSVLNKELEKRSNDLLINFNGLEKFAYMASHDLQEPLRTITSYIQLLQRKYKDKLDEEGNEFMEYVVGGSRRMKTLINDILEYSKISNDERVLESVDCNEILKEVLQNLNFSIKENNATVLLDMLPVIQANRIQMIQLFQNLISNSIKFKSNVAPFIKISAKKVKNYYLFSVEDNGIGIKKEYSTKIFEIFQHLHSTQRYPGTGIGLAICMEIVKGHGGEMYVESEDGKGSTFYFTIPEAA